MCLFLSGEDVHPGFRRALLAIADQGAEKWSVRAVVKRQAKTSLEGGCFAPNRVSNNNFRVIVFENS